MADFTKLILDELLRYRQSPASATAGFKSLKHNDALCPSIERQLNTFLDCSVKYHKVAYDVQGPRDRGTDIVLRYTQDEETRYLALQVKSYDDLKERNYLNILKAQLFEVEGEYGAALSHCFVVLCTDAVEHKNQLRNIKKDCSRSAHITVVDPAYAWTFLRLSDMRIDALVQVILKEDDAVYREARKSISDLAPLEVAILVSAILRARESGSNQVDLSSVRAVGFVDDALEHIPDWERDEFFYRSDPDEDEEDDIPDAVDSQRDSEVRFAEAVDAMDDSVLFASPNSDSAVLNSDSCAAIEAIMLDAQVRFGYSGSELVAYVFEALDVARTFDLDFDAVLA